MQLEEIRALVAEDLQSVDQTIVQRLASDIVLVNQVSQYIIGAGGSAAANFGNVADPKEAAGIIEDAVQRFGRKAQGEKE